MLLFPLVLAGAAAVAPVDHLLIETTQGDLVVALRRDVAPLTVDAVAALAAAGAYDDTPFLRVVPGFVVQLGVASSRRTPLTVEQAALLKNLPLEISTRAQPVRGAVALVRDADHPDEAQSSFAILLGDAPQLDGRYSIFGVVERGMDVADAIGSAATGLDRAPLDPIVLGSATLVPAGAEPSSLRPATSARHYRRLSGRWMVSTLAALLALSGALVLRARRGGRSRALASLPLLVAAPLGFALLTPWAVPRPVAALALIVALQALFWCAGRIEADAA